MTEQLPVPGWYNDPDDQTRMRYWDGERWPSALSPEQRRAALAARVAHWVGQHGYRVESQTDEQAVLVTGHRPNHLLHLILSVLTLGLWLIVWVILAISAGEKRKTVSITADGRAIES